MPVVLEGGCLVGELKEGKPLQHGNLRVWRHVGCSVGARAISLRVLEIGPGISPGLHNEGCDEALYVLEGEAGLFLDGSLHRARPGTGIYLRPGVRLTVECLGPNPLTLVGSQCPDPGPSLALEPARVTPLPGAGAARMPLVRFDEKQSQVADDGRWYRVLVDERVGSAQVTQFIGVIPPGRAPDHFHRYEEVLCILRGKGRLWAGESTRPRFTA